MANAKFYEDNEEIAYDREYMANAPSVLSISIKVKSQDTADQTIKANITIRPVQKDNPNANKSSKSKIKSEKKAKKKTKKQANAVILTRRCKNCGKSFDLNAKTIYWYRDRGLSLPLRCEDCRKENKKEKEEKQKDETNG